MLVDDATDCLAIGDVNHQALFPRVAAIVHHGGAGTTTAAAAAGVPQVIIPQMFDQHYWSQRVHALGIGVAHTAGAPTGQSLRQALERALQRDLVASATGCANAVRRDGAQIAANRILGFV